MKDAALKASGTIFLFVAVLHAIRFFFRTVVLVGGVEIPVMASAAGALICLLLAAWMFAALKR